MKITAATETPDIVEVYWGDDRDVVQLLVDQGARRQTNGVILADGVPEQHRAKSR